MTPGSPNDDELEIAQQSFHSIELKFTVKNLTSRTELKPGTPVRLCEWLEQGFVLELPLRSCGEGHNLQVEIQPIRGTEQFPIFVANCKVTALTHNEDATDQVTLNMLQFEASSWRDLKALFSRRQEEILAFLSSVRGYD